MIKNSKDTIMLILITGILILLGIIIIGDYVVAVLEQRPLDVEIITLMKMSVTGLIGIIAGYFGNNINRGGSSDGK